MLKQFNVMNLVLSKYSSNVKNSSIFKNFV